PTGPCGEGGTVGRCGPCAACTREVTGGIGLGGSVTGPSTSVPVAFRNEDGLMGATVFLPSSITPCGIAGAAGLAGTTGGGRADAGEALRAEAFSGPAAASAATTPALAFSASWTS